MVGSLFAWNSFETCRGGVSNKPQDTRKIGHARIGGPLMTFQLQPRLK